MKKFSVLLTLLLVMVSSSVFAGSIDYLSNQSAKFLMTFTRTASTDASADIANYNPAGTAFIPEGFYIDVSNQTLLKPYVTKTNTYGNLSYLPYAGIGVSTEVNGEFEQSKPTAILPNVYMVYNFGDMGGGKLATYAHVGVSAGGGSLDWDKGTQPLFSVLSNIFKAGTGLVGFVNKQSFEASSVYYTAHVGASYALVQNMFSLSLGGKAIKADRSMAISGSGYYFNGASLTPVFIDGEYKYDATGYTPVIGIDIKPIEELTLSARYENETKMRFTYHETKLNGTPGAADGGAGMGCTYVGRATLYKAGYFGGNGFQYDLPAILALGAEFKVMPELTVMTSATFYYLGKTNMGKAYFLNDSAFQNAKEVDDYYGTGYEISVGTTFQATQELKIGLGYVWTQSGVKESYFDDARTFLTCAGNPPLDSWTIGTGLTYTLAGTGADITLAGSWTHYIPEHFSIRNPDGSLPGPATAPMVVGSYHKEVYNIGLGVGYKI